MVSIHDQFGNLTYFIGVLGHETFHAMANYAIAASYL